MILKPKIIPSLMAKNQKDLNILFQSLGPITKEFHLDISDGKFVSSRYNYFPFRLKSGYKYSAHLMISNPEDWIKKYGRKVDLVIANLESIRNFDKYKYLVKKFHQKVAVALSPETEIKAIKSLILDLDYVLILTVHPGFYGSKFLLAPLQKIRQIKKLNSKIKIFVDGGMSPKTIGHAKKAGADYIISGSYLAESDHPKLAFKELQKALR